MLADFGKNFFASEVAKTFATGFSYGVLDKICPFEFTKMMHKGIHHSKLIRFEQSRYGLFYDELVKCNQGLQLFLSDVRYKIGMDMDESR